MPRRFLSLCLAVGCSPATPETDLDTDSTLADDDATRVAFGRVHDANDDNIGLAGAIVTMGGVQTTSDVTGQYRLEGPMSSAYVRVDATADGWTPHVLHLPPDAPEVEVWPGLLRLEDSDVLASLMSASSDTTATFDPTTAYIVVQVRHVGGMDSYLEPAEVRMTVDGKPAPDLYMQVYNEALDACLPARVDDGVATASVVCDGLVVVPGVAEGAKVGIDIRHPERTCARTLEDRLAGLTASEVAYEIRAVANGLNLTGVECEPVR